MDDVAAAATAPSSLCLSALRVGSLVHDVRVTLHIAEAVASSGVTSNGGGKRPQSQSSLRFQAKQRARALQRAPASPSSSSAPLLIPAASGLVRCALSDHSASVIADVPQHLIDSRWHSAVAVRVDGQISYEAGHLIFTGQAESTGGEEEVQADRTAPQWHSRSCALLCCGAVIPPLSAVSSLSRASDLPSTSSSSSSSLRCVALSSLLNPRSVVSHASGVWLLRLVAGELFALLLLSPIDADAQSSPDDDEQDGSVDMQPPYQMMRAPWTDDDGGRQQCARDALHTTTSVRDDQFVLLTAVQSAPILRTSASNGQERAGWMTHKHAPQRSATRQRGVNLTSDAHAGCLRVCVVLFPAVSAVQLVLFCGIVLPGVDLSGDHVDETVLDREHWVHAARAMSELPAEWSESLTQVITSLGMWVDRWTRRMDLEATDGNAQAHASDEEEELFDHKGRVRKQIREAHDAGTNSQAQKDGDIELPALTLTQLVSGLDASSPSFAQHLVRDLNVALESCESTLQALRQQQRDKAEDEDDEEEEDEDGDAKLTQADPASTAAPPQAPQARRPRGAAPTSAAKLVSGSRAKAPAIVDDAKVRRLRASLRTVLGAIESGQRRRLPVCILTGFLGSGKTSLLNHLLGADHGLRIGVIVNDFSEVNVDAALLHAARPEHLVELSNGCICCTLRADLFTSVVELVATQKVDYICVESTGLGEPAPIAATFTFDFSDADAQGAGMQTYGLSSLAQLCQIDCIATVVDSAAVFNTINKTMQQAPCSDDNSTAMEGQHDAQAQKQHHDKRGAGSSKRHKQEKATAAARSPAAVSTSSTASAAAALSAIRASESSTKSVLSLLIDQLEYCNVLVLNKSSLLSASQLQLVEEFVRLNNVAATCVRADYGRIQPDIIIGANKFNQQEVTTQRHTSTNEQ